jgi:hypothetical protein
MTLRVFKKREGNRAAARTCSPSTERFRRRIKVIAETSVPYGFVYYLCANGANGQYALVSTRQKNFEYSAVKKWKIQNGKMENVGSCGSRRFKLQRSYPIIKML